MKLDFLIVGATKCSTTSIHHALSRHPEIQLSVKRKESNFFIKPKDILGCNEIYKYSDSIYRLDDFNALFDCVTDARLVGEVCTSYFHFSDNCVPHIKSNNADAKIIILLRDPVKRMISNFTHNVRDGTEHRSLKEAVGKNMQGWVKDVWFMDNIVHLSKYAEHVENYKSVFKNCKVFILEDYEDISLLMSDIIKYLNVSPFYEDSIPKINFSGIPSSIFLNKFVRSNQFLYTNMRRCFKVVFGAQNTQRLKNLIDEHNLKRLNVPTDDLSHYYKIFEDDIHKTSKLLNRDLAEVWSAP